MKYHKIKNIPLEVCTAEQKIAYNLASSYSDLFVKKYHNMPCQFQKSELIHNAVCKMLEWYQSSYNFSNKYNIDAIFSALNAGLENYFNAKHSILSSYVEIGKMFPAHYL